MLPIDSLPADVARNIDGVCFDIDDTVTTHGTLDPEAYAALFALRQAGIKLLAVTGRPLGWAELVARQWPVDGAIGENGAGFIARTDQGLRFGYWDDEHVREQQQQILERIRERVAEDMPHVRVSNDSWARRCDLAFDVNEHERLSREDIDALCAILHQAGAHVTVSSVHAHAQLGSHDKALGIVMAARELFGLSETFVRSRFMFVGDSGNDAAAFAWFEQCAGVANIAKYLDRIPRPPRFVADASYGAGFAEIARVLLARRTV